MKKIVVTTTLVLINLMLHSQVGIGTNSPDSSAKLDVFSTTSGFLPPRMTLTQRNAINNPVAGLIIWCTDCIELQVFDGVIWKNLSGKAASGIDSFPNVLICNQVWTTRNLDVSTYRNGDVIPNVTNPTLWANLTSGAWCWYNNDSTNYANIYGKLYNWYAINDPRGLAPQGWHIPTDNELNILTTCLGGESVAGGKMKTTGTSLWIAPNTGATNSSGFSALPSGLRSNGGGFVVVGEKGYVWSSTEGGTSAAWQRVLLNDSGAIQRALGAKNGGFPVRCVKD